MATIRRQISFSWARRWHQAKSYPPPAMHLHRFFAGRSVLGFYLDFFLLSASNWTVSGLLKFSSEQRFISSPSSGLDCYDFKHNMSFTEIMWKALQERRTLDAWEAFQVLKKGHLVLNRECISELVAQLALEGSPSSLLRAEKLANELKLRNQVNLLNHCCLSKLAVAFSETQMGSYACSMVDLMIELGYLPSVRVWSGIVNNIGKDSRQACMALRIFDKMCKCSMQLKLRGSNLDALHINGEKTSSSDHLDSNGVIPDLVAFNIGLTICSKLGYTEDAEKMMSAMYDFGISPDYHSFNYLIGAYAKSKQPNMLSKMPSRMMEAQVAAHSSTLRILTGALLGSGNIPEAEKLMSLMQPDTVETNKESLGHDKLQSLEDDKLQSWLGHVLPDKQMYADLLQAYAKEGRLDDAVKLLQKINAGDSTTEVTQAGVIWALVVSGSIDAAETIILYMAAHNKPASVYAYNSLIQGYCTTDQVEKAEALLENMKTAGVDPISATYGPYMEALIRANDKLGAHNMLKNLMEMGLMPPERAYVSLIHAYASDKQASMVTKVLNTVQNHPNVKVNISTWNFVIEYLSKSLLIHEAKRSLNDMVESGVQPTSTTYWYLVKGLVTKNQMQEVLLLWSCIRQDLEKNRDGVEVFELSKDLTDALLYAFVKGAYFKRASELVAYADAFHIPLDRIAFKDLFLKYHLTRFTSKHRSQRRIDKHQRDLQEMEEFKKWLGLPPLDTSNKKRRNNFLPPSI